MSRFLNIAIAAAVGAGKIILQRFHDVSYEVKEKTPNDFVTEVDLAAEKEILYQIQKFFPQHSILSEEQGLIADQDSDYQWLIDPLDGTTNFLHRFPHFAVSIALKHKDEIIVGVVYDPTRNELFAAEKGQGAKLNNRRIRVSNQPSLKAALLGTGIPYQHREHVDHYVKILGALIQGTAGIRRAGAAALDLAYVAAGRLDGFWEFGLNPWDIAAGVLLVSEAGGLVGDLSGGQKHLETGDTLAACPRLFEEMAQRIKVCERDIAKTTSGSS